MRDIALHVLDIIENAVTAGATRIDVKVKTEKKNVWLLLWFHLPQIFLADPFF